MVWESQYCDDGRVINDEQSIPQGLFQESIQLLVHHLVSNYIFRCAMDPEVHPLWDHGELQAFIYLHFLLRPFREPHQHLGQLFLHSHQPY